MSIVRYSGPVLLAALLAGCRGEFVVHEGPPPPPPTATWQVTETHGPGGLIVVQETELVEAPTPPPEVVVEMRPACPSVGAVWIDGYYKYTHHGWHWCSGHWVVEHPVGQVYVAGHWDMHGSVCVWSPGCWCAAGSAPAPCPAPAPAPVVTAHEEVHVGLGGVSLVLEEVELRQAPLPPPAPIVEVRTACPCNGAVWIEGHYVYGKKGWRWSQGHWFTEKHPGTVYVTGHWDNRGGTYIWIEGSWR